MNINRENFCPQLLCFVHGGILITVRTYLSPDSDIATGQMFVGNLISVLTGQSRNNVPLACLTFFYKVERAKGSNGHALNYKIITDGKHGPKLLSLVVESILVSFRNMSSITWSYFREIYIEAPTPEDREIITSIMASYNLRVTQQNQVVNLSDSRPPIHIPGTRILTPLMTLDI